MRDNADDNRLVATTSKALRRYLHASIEDDLRRKMVFLGAPRIRPVKKETKLYLWDWSQTPRTGERFENLVACHLLKYCHFMEDTEGHRMDLRFLRDTDRREVDFVVIRDNEPLFAVECKTGERSPSPAIAYFRQRTRIADFYQVHLGERDYVANGTRVLPFRAFCTEFALP